MRQVFLHVGCRKTGTTSVQQALLAARPELRAQGVVLPLGRRPNTLRHLLDPVDPVTPETAARLEATAQAIRQARGERALLTLERLAQLRPEQVAPIVEALAEFDLHVVVTARDLGRQLPSEWQQIVRDGYRLDWATFVDAVRGRSPAAGLFWDRQDLAAVTARWGAGVPAHQVHLIVIPHAAPRSWLMESFGRVVGFDPAVLSGTPQAEIRNVSLGHAEAEAVRQVQRELHRRDPAMAYAAVPEVRKWLAAEVLASAEAQPPVLRAEDQEWVSHVATEQVAQLRARGYDVVGSLENLMPRFHQPPAAVNLPREPSRAEVLALADEIVSRWESAGRPPANPMRVDENALADRPSGY